MKVELPAVLVFTESVSGGERMYLTIETEVRGKKHMLYCSDFSYVVNIGNLIRDMAMSIGRSHPGHEDQGDTEVSDED